jgi:hypothetical protein
MAKQTTSINKESFLRSKFIMVWRSFMRFMWRLRRVASAIFHWGNPGVLISIFIGVALAMAGIGQNAHLAIRVNLAFVVAYIAFAFAALWSVGSYQVSEFLKERNPDQHPWDNLSPSAYKRWRWGGTLAIVVLFIFATSITALFHMDRLSSISSSMPPLDVAVRASLVNMNRDMRATTPFWVHYHAIEDFVSPVAVLTYVDITNQTDRDETIKNYAIAIKTQQCGWTYLTPIREDTVTSFLGPLTNARPLDFRQNGLNYLLKSAIPKHRTVSGWLLFDSLIKCATSVGDPVQYKVSISTYNGINFDQTSDPRPITDKSPLNSSTEATPIGPQFFVNGKPVDLSHMHIKFYGDPN